MAKQILLVDDDPAVGGAVAIILELEGYKVDLVTSAGEALTKVQFTTYDLIITDHRMPQTSGLQLARELKRHCPGQKILMITGVPPGVANPAVDLVLQKPVPPLELRRAVNQLVNAN